MAKKDKPLPDQMYMWREVDKDAIGEDEYYLVSDDEDRLPLQRGALVGIYKLERTVKVKRHVVLEDVK